MRGEAMKKACLELERRGTKLSELVALEFFAREGDWQTLAYAPKVRALHAWELDKGFEAGLRSNLPAASIRIGDSFELAKDPTFRGKFGFIVFDNPQGIFGGYCEHFEALKTVPLLLASEGVVIFNVNRRPFNYEASPEWKARREKYYGVRNTAELELEFLLKFYEKAFSEMGLHAEYSFHVARNAEYLSYLVFKLRRPS